MLGDFLRNVGAFSPSTLEYLGKIKFPYSFHSAAGFSTKQDCVPLWGTENKKKNIIFLTF